MFSMRAVSFFFGKSVIKVNLAIVHHLLIIPVFNLLLCLVVYLLCVLLYQCCPP